MPDNEGLRMILRTVIFGAVTLLSSFFCTLWLIDHHPWSSFGSASATLEGSTAADERQLAQDAERAGFQKATKVVGASNSLTRIDGERLRTMGWAADPDGDGAPMTIFAFSGGRSIMRANTSGARPDVNEFLKLPASSPATRNVAFEGTLRACNSGQPVIYIAVQEDTKRFAIIGQLPCPPK